MTDRVTEVEAEAAISWWKDKIRLGEPDIARTLRALLAERAALEVSVGNLKDEILRLDTRLAEARREFAREVRERMHRARRDAYQGPDLSAIAEFTNWIRAEAEGKG